MDLLKSLNSDISKKEIEDTLQIAESIDADIAFSNSVLSYLPESERLDELKFFKSKADKAAEREAQEEKDRNERARQRKVAAGEGATDGAVQGSLKARTQLLNKQWGIAKLTKDGKLPPIPKGMSQEDYEIWVSHLRTNKKDDTPRDSSKDMGPRVKDIVKMGGKTFVVTGNEGMTAILRGEDKQTHTIAWDKLGKPTDAGDRKIYRA